MTPRPLCLAALVTAVIGAGAITAPARTEPAKGDVVGFCKAHRNLDVPGRLFFGSRYKPGAPPPQIAALDGQLRWRCMDGRVLVCSDSADGDWCSKKDVSRTPAPLLRQACREEPDKASFNFADAHYSAFDWRCNQGVPVISRSYALDRRGFFKAPWTPLIVTHGLVTGPTDFPPGPR